MNHPPPKKKKKIKKIPPPPPPPYPPPPPPTPTPKQIKRTFQLLNVIKVVSASEKRKIIYRNTHVFINKVDTPLAWSCGINMICLLAAEFLKQNRKNAL
jgi:hypothetical protein